MQAFAKPSTRASRRRRSGLVADQVRGLPVGRALQALAFEQEGGGLVKGVLESAIANAEHNEGADIDELTVSAIQVDEGPQSSRMHGGAGKVAATASSSAPVTSP